MAFLSVGELKDNNIVYAKHQTVLCTTNCVGTMGAGLALEIATRFPKAEKCYLDHHKAGTLKPNTLINVDCDWHHILLFPTKIHWADPSPIELILENIAKLKQVYKDLNITSLAIPPLGVGLGWLSEEDGLKMLAALKDLMESLPIQVDCYLGDDLLEKAKAI